MFYGSQVGTLRGCVGPHRIGQKKHGMGSSMTKVVDNRGYCFVVRN